jgi:hypothetical protein
MADIPLLRRAIRTPAGITTSPTKAAQFSVMNKYNIRLDIREVGRRDPLWWLHSWILRLCVLMDGGGVEFVCRVKRV